MTHNRANKFDFNFKTLFVEFLLLAILFTILVTKKFYWRNNTLFKNVGYLSISITLYVFSAFFSVFYSYDFVRSLNLFLFGILGPFFLYLLIVYKFPFNLHFLSNLLTAFLYSLILYLIVSYMFAFRFGFNENLLETRANQNIYGSNSVIGVLTFALPLIFIYKKIFSFDFVNRRILVLFSILSIVWIIISLSRWGYATLFLSFIFVSIFVNKSFSLKYVVVFIILFALVTFFIPNIIELIVFRFTGLNSLKDLTFENIMYVSSDEYRLVRWENAFKNVIFENPYFGIGIGNNHIVDPFGNSDAHNLFVNLIIEQGFLSLSCIFLVFLSILTLVRKILYTVNNLTIKVLALSFGFGILLFHFWSLTGGAYIQSGGIISAVKNYYFFFSMGMIAYISKY